jgi:hypothetical protein
VGLGANVVAVNDSGTQIPIRPGVLTSIPHTAGTTDVFVARAVQMAVVNPVCSGAGAPTHAGLDLATAVIEHL